jgi:hypothetical protein
MLHLGVLLANTLENLGVRDSLDFWDGVLNTKKSRWEGKTRFATARWDLVKGANYFEQGGDAAGEKDLGWGAVWDHTVEDYDFNLAQASVDGSKEKPRSHPRAPAASARLRRLRLYRGSTAGRTGSREVGGQARQAPTNKPEN